MLLTIIFLTTFQLVVQKFVKKTQSTLSNHITEGTTHVIMKTGLLGARAPHPLLTDHVEFYL